MPAWAKVVGPPVLGQLAVGSLIFKVLLGLGKCDLQKEDPGG